MVERRLRKSIEQYRRLLAHAQRLDQLLVKGDPDQLRAYTAELQKLQGEAEQHDRELLEEMAQDMARWQAHSLFPERMQLLKQIVEMNNLLLPRIRGMMSVNAAELEQIKSGRVAVTGYHSTGTRPRKSVRSVG